jgi:major membrane immunogen (membrane-anchored lipoprotein)
MKRNTGLIILGAALSLLFTGCAKEQPAAEQHAGHTAAVARQAYKDGTYKAQSSADERGAIGEITIAVQQGKITQVEFKGIQKDGKIKDIEYGKTNGKIENQEFYNKAQQAVKGTATYAPKLVEAQDLNKVDAVAGATVSYKQFLEAGKKALGQAQK